ncbi:Scn10a [Symbiodinium necroappetens]|uniref:Scn10a protein n=1 Tax=Symbiodinium necroappetens TaxID=1628268 RepID=A0A813CHD6_9DINO|nr:Scn10a [Symbiodinium necroappetens]
MVTGTGDASRSASSTPLLQTEVHALHQRLDVLQREVACCREEATALREYLTEAQRTQAEQQSCLTDFIPIIACPLKDGAYKLPSQLAAGAEVEEELLIMARAVWRARQRIHDEAPSELSRSRSSGQEAAIAAALLPEALKAYRLATSAADLSPAGSSIRAVLSWYNHSVRLALETKGTWPRKELSALALKMGAAMLPPATPCEFVEEPLCWWAFGQHSRDADWLGHGYFWRQIPQELSPGFLLENAAGNAMNDFDCLEGGFRRLDGKVLAADYSLLRSHFPDLQGKSNVEVDAWLLEEAAWLSEGQAQRLDEGGDHHHLISSKGILGGSRSALRVRSGGRAATFLVGDRYGIDEEGNFRADMLDVKGIGTHVMADISSEKVTGLLGLADALRELAFQRLVQRLLDLEGLSDA